MFLGGYDLASQHALKSRWSLQAVKTLGAVSRPSLAIKVDLMFEFVCVVWVKMELWREWKLWRGV